MKATLLTLATIFFLISTSAQNIEKVYLDKDDKSVNYYSIIYPPNLPWKGYIFIIPGFGEDGEAVLKQTDLPKLTAQSGLLTIIPTFQHGVTSFGVDSISQQSLHAIVQDVINKHKLVDQHFYIGGFSIGGSCAIKYVENTSIKPTAVFAIDPPLDFERFYHAAKRDIRLSKNSNPSPENVYMLERIEKEAGGTPQTNITGYYELSPYSFSDTSQYALRTLKQVPIRLYSEPDINWWITNRKADLTSMNVTDCSAFINELNRLGNKNATLILTLNKGYRNPGHIRHPHSWSIVDNDELITWLLNQKQDLIHLNY